MDKHLRDLERQAAATGSPEIIRAYLQALYRSGHYRKPTRKQIKDIIRRQMREYREGRRVSFSPRYYYPDEGQEGLNKSNLQHPTEVSAWGGDYGEWSHALRDALPGEQFETNVYYWDNWGGGHGEWSLSDTVTLKVPEEIYYYNDKYYGIPPEFTSYKKKYRRNSDVKLQELLRKYNATGDRDALNKYIRQLKRSSNLDDPNQLKHYIWALDQDEEIDSLPHEEDEIRAGMARGFFADRWATELEERNIPFQGDYYYDAPTTPPDAMAFAKEYEEALTKQVGLSLNAFYEFVRRLPRDEYYTRELTPEHFGYLISMSAMGHGVGLWEAVPSVLRKYVEVPHSDDYEIGNMCHICGDVAQPDDDLYVQCDNPECGDDYSTATICPGCRGGCEDCDVILCEPCTNQHECHDEYEPDAGDIATEDHENWFQYGKLYHKGDTASLWEKLDEDQFWPNIFWISDHGNVFQIIREEAEDDSEDSNENENCPSCGSSETWVPTYCNFGHCAECFDALNPEHECGWDGTEHESYGPSSDLPGNMTTFRRHNPDDRLRHWERESSSGDIEAQVKLLAHKLRSGLIPLRNIELAWCLDHPVARQLIGDISNLRPLSVTSEIEPANIQAQFITQVRQITEIDLSRFKLQLVIDNLFYAPDILLNWYVNILRPLLPHYEGLFGKITNVDYQHIAETTAEIPPDLLQISELISSTEAIARGEITFDEFPVFDLPDPQNTIIYLENEDLIQTHLTNWQLGIFNSIANAILALTYDVGDPDSKYSYLSNYFSNEKTAHIIRAMNIVDLGYGWSAEADCRILGYTDAGTEASANRLKECMREQRERYAKLLADMLLADTRSEPPEISQIVQASEDLGNPNI